MPRFYQYEGDLMDLPHDDNHLVFRWLEPGCKILFSVSRMGNGASCHFATDKAGLRKLKQAVNEFCEFCFWLFDWCEMVLAKVKKPSVSRILPRCGFKFIITGNNIEAFARYK